jgi:tyrosine-protein phosphatase YwqE
MFRFFSKSKPKPEKFDYAVLKTDMHSHLLPGIDDGVQDLEASVTLIRGMRELGYQKLITTPHVIWDLFKNTPAIIHEKLYLLQKAVADAGIDIEIQAAAEYFLDEHVEELLKKKEPLLTLSGNKVLAEFSMAFPSLNIKDLLFEMVMNGYQPVIAHPERYVYLQKNKDFYRELKDIGCLFQLNLLSIYGYYGRSVKDLSEYLLSEDYYDLIGTDLHNINHLEALQKIGINSRISKLMSSDKLINKFL